MSNAYIYGLASLTFAGQPIGDISEESIRFGGQDGTETPIYAAQKRGAPIIILQGTPGTTEMEFDLVNLHPSHIKSVMGGEVAGKKWTAPTGSVKREGAFVITTGDGTIISGKGSLTARFDGSLKWDELLKIKCKMTLLEGEFTVTTP
ncbi:MAG: hypothetical protein SPI72_03295 [Porphyromonas sp.]|nr:hypothetical protein [Porphyromonas sp.]